MEILAKKLIALVALEHLYILYLEMFAWGWGLTSKVLPYTLSFQRRNNWVYFCGYPLHIDRFRNCHIGFGLFINTSFFFLEHFLISLSLSITSRGESK